jgi:hypothetical protein
MLTKPSFEHLGRSFRNEIDRPMLLEIDEDCSIDPSFAQSKVVDAEHTRHVGFREREGANNAEQGIALEGKRRHRARREPAAPPRENPRPWRA